MSLVFGTVELGWHPGIRSINEAIDTIQRLLDGADLASVSPDVNIVFHCPGDIALPEHEGVRSGVYDESEQCMMIQVAVPEAVMDNAEPHSAILQLCRDAVVLADSELARRRVAFDATAYLAAIERIRQFL